MKNPNCFSCQKETPTSYGTTKRRGRMQQWKLLCIKCDEEFDQSLPKNKRLVEELNHLRGEG